MTTLIMHGSYGTPNNGWYRWLEAELITLGHQVILEQFPVENWDNITQIGEDKCRERQPVESLQSWGKYFADVILPKVKDTDVDLVAHSIAPLFMLHMLEKYELRIRTAVFVSPFFDLGRAVWQFYFVNKTFYGTDFNFNRIRSQVKTSFMLHGDNDPFVPTVESQLFAEKLGGAFITIHNGGHCGGPLFKKFPLVLELLKCSA